MSSFQNFAIVKSVDLVAGYKVIVFGFIEGSKRQFYWSFKVRLQNYSFGVSLVGILI